MQQTGISAPDRSAAWNDRSSEGSKSLMEYFQVSGEKSATTLKSTGFVAYHIQGVLWNCSDQYFSWLMEN